MSRANLLSAFVRGKLDAQGRDRESAKQKTNLTTKNTKPTKPTIHHGSTRIGLTMDNGPWTSQKDQPQSHKEKPRRSSPCLRVLRGKCSSQSLSAANCLHPCPSVFIRGECLRVSPIAETAPLRTQNSELGTHHCPTNEGRRRLPLSGSKASVRSEAPLGPEFVARPLCRRQKQRSTASFQASSPSTCNARV